MKESNIQTESNQVRAGSSAGSGPLNSHDRFRSSSQAFPSRRAVSDRRSGILGAAIIRRTLIRFAMACLIFALSGCAVFDRKNTILVNAVEQNLVPESGAARWLLAPIYLPVGLAAGVLDAFLVHPLRMIPEAISDTDDFLWEFSDETGYVTHAGSIVYRTAVSPVVFTVIWLARSAFIGFDDGDLAEPESRPEGSYAELLQAGNKPGLIYDLNRCSITSPATDLLVRTIGIYEAELDSDAEGFYSNPAFLATECLIRREKDSAALKFFQDRLLNSPDGRWGWLEGRSIDYLQRMNSRQSAMILIQAVRQESLSEELRMAILRGLVAMDNEEARRLILDSMSGSRSP